MKCPALSELPRPPLMNSGWPWTQECEPLPEKMPDGSEWPRISVITPSYNQGKFIEATIRSVLLQGYPHLEYIIMDGGSTDGSTEIIKKYEPWLYWVSEPDGGQSRGLNNGFSKASGEIIGWINSDDFYLPEAFAHVSKASRLYEEAGVFYGKCRLVGEAGDDQGDYWKPRSFDLGDLLTRNQIPQPTAFIRRSIFHKFGYMNENYRLIHDYEFWIRVFPHCEFLYCPEYIAAFRMHPGSGSYRISAAFIRETLTLYRQLLQKPMFQSRYLKRILKKSIARTLRLKGLTHLSNHELRGLFYYFFSLRYDLAGLLKLDSYLDFLRRFFLVFSRNKSI
ncbi:MAG: glycosyltransferase [Chlamydiae bacterium]|nr:glycosyltransferase [Chlamydiota bacterium]